VPVTNNALGTGLGLGFLSDQTLAPNVGQSGSHFPKPRGKGQKKEEKGCEYLLISPSMELM
jgi:hypothetical protein